MTYRPYLDLRVRRLWNLITSGGMLNRRRGPVRSGTAPRRAANPIFAALFGVVLMAAAFGASFAMQNQLDTAVLQAAYLSLCLVVAVLMNLSSREFSAGEWDLEWLITLPVSRLQLLVMRVGERALINPVAFFLLFPGLCVTFLHQGHGWLGALGFGLVTSLPLMLVAAVIQTLIDTGLRVRLKPSSLKNLQSLFSISSVVLFYGAIPRNGELPFAIRLFARSFGPSLEYWPTGRAMAAAVGPAFVPLVALVAECLALTGLGLGAMLWMLREGVVSGSGQVNGPRRVSQAAKPPPTGRLGPMVRKELCLLARDRNYLVQTVLTPILVLIMQVYLGATKTFAHGASLNLIAVSGFGLASYAMIFSTFNILQGEGQALWLWYTWPCALHTLILRKLRPWLGVALGYGILFAVYAYVTHPQMTPEFVGLFALAAVGIVICVTLAAALGVFSFDPQSLEVGRRVHVSFVYLYMLMSSTFAGLFFIPDIWQRVVGVILIGLVALAFWQKALRHLPYLLDPGAAPRPAVSLADGMMAAYGFFLLLLLLQIMIGNFFYAYSLAGGLVFVVLKLYYRHLQVQDVPRFGGGDLAGDLIYGLGGGALCAIFGLLYMNANERFGWFTESLTDALRLPHDKFWAYGLVAIISAPAFEEYVFRGVVLKGFRLTLPRAGAIVGSAVLFASLHPTVAVGPVFVLGLVTGWLADRRGNLTTSWTAHLVYNVCLVGVPWWLSRAV